MHSKQKNMKVLYVVYKQYFLRQSLTLSNKLNRIFCPINENGKESSRAFAYLDMVHLLLDLTESERDSICQTYIETLRSMLPYYRSFNHNRYFKWGLVYFIDMIRLKDKNQDVFNEFSLIMLYHGQSVRQNSIQYRPIWHQSTV